MSKPARVFRHCRIPGHDSHMLGRSAAPAWCFVNVPMRDISSSALRGRGEGASAS